MSRRSRRIVGAATLLGLPLMFVWSSFWMTTTVPTMLWGPVSFILIGITVVGSFVMYRFIRDRADLAGRTLDERQRLLRDQAWIRSYEVLAIVVIAFVTVLGIRVLGFGQAVVLDAAIVSAVVLCLGVLLPVLPVVALAWIEPDSLSDD